MAILSFSDQKSASGFDGEGSGGGDRRRHSKAASGEVQEIWPASAEGAQRDPDSAEL